MTIGSNIGCKKSAFYDVVYNFYQRYRSLWGDSGFRCASMYFYDPPLKVSEKNAVLKRAINVLMAALLAFAFNKFVSVNIIHFYSQKK